MPEALGLTDVAAAEFPEVWLKAGRVENNARAKMAAPIVPVRNVASPY